MAFDVNMIKKLYATYPERVAAARTLIGKPLTLTEKILYAIVCVVFIFLLNNIVQTKWVQYQFVQLFGY